MRLSVIILTLLFPVIICIFIYLKTRKIYLFRTFALGAAFMFVGGILIQSLVQTANFDYMHYSLATGALVFLISAIIEESERLISVMIGAFQSTQFRTIKDGIIYSVSASLGMLTYENMLYVYKAKEYSIITNTQINPLIKLISPEAFICIVRFVTAVPAHIIYGIILGYFIGLAKYDDRKRILFISLGVVTSSFMHFISNFGGGIVGAASFNKHDIWRVHFATVMFVNSIGIFVSIILMNKIKKENSV